MIFEKVRSSDIWHPYQVGQVRSVGQDYLGISNNIEESNDVGPPCEVLKNLDLSLNLLLLDRLQDLDDAFLVVNDIDALKDFRVLSPTWREI